MDFLLDAVLLALQAGSHNRGSSSDITHPAQGWLRPTRDQTIVRTRFGDGRISINLFIHWGQQIPEHAKPFWLISMRKRP